MFNTIIGTLLDTAKEFARQKNYEEAYRTLRDSYEKIMEDYQESEREKENLRSEIDSLRETPKPCGDKLLNIGQVLYIDREEGNIEGPFCKKCYYNKRGEIPLDDKQYNAGLADMTDSGGLMCDCPVCREESEYSPPPSGG